MIWIGSDLIGTCPNPWLPGTICRFSQTAIASLPLNKSFTYYVEVRGEANGMPFLYRKGFTGPPQQMRVNPVWVIKFIELVNRARGGVSLIENRTLDRSAAVRFNTAVSEPDISDYGLALDTASFFGNRNVEQNISEILLYPESFSPDTYASYLRAYAPLHWSALTNSEYTQFGYYIGTGPYETVMPPCSVTEISHAGLNITQFFERAGCSVSVKQYTWLVIIPGRKPNCSGRKGLMDERGLPLLFDTDFRWSIHACIRSKEAILAGERIGS